MRQSQLFTKISREDPKDEPSINARFLIRAGFVEKLSAGIYSYLPLGLLVLKKIENIIREEMKKIGGQEVLLPALHPKQNWLETNRWQAPEMFKLKSRSGKDFGLGWTHEEVITPLIKKSVHSYRDLPLYVYQIQDKFRDELRVKSGLLRGSEFIMKDLYSFHIAESDLNSFYEKAKKAYFKIFQRCSLKKYTFLTLASGGTFSKYSHEFQTATPHGEDDIHVCSKCRVAVNKEIIKEHPFCPQCRAKKLEQKKAIEVGNIFKLYDKYSKAFGFKLKDKYGEEKNVLMGCYGIGLSRLMGVVVEIHHDDRGIIWPEEIAPCQIHLLDLGQKRQSEKIYGDLQKQGLEVLYDDRNDKTAGEKFAEADLIGSPIRVVVSRRTLQEKSVEIKKRTDQKARLCSIKSFLISQRI